jgi:hypothetical protein
MVGETAGVGMGPVGVKISGGWGMDAGAPGARVQATNKQQVKMAITAVMLTFRNISQHWLSPPGAESRPAKRQRTVNDADQWAKRPLRMTLLACWSRRRFLALWL